MTRSEGPFRTRNPWARIAWWSIAALIVVGWMLGFVVLGREQQNGPPLSPWASICRGFGFTADLAPANEPQPPLRTPTRIAWTRETFVQIATGNAERGEFIAINCTACHGDNGVSASGLYPTLASMKADTIYKQLDDFRAGKRSWGAMNAIAQVLSPQDSADVAAYFATRSNKSERPPLNAEQHVVGQRLVIHGDPARGIAACSACHGPGGYKVGAPSLQGQQPDYIERQLAAFAQRVRQNDINEQMRTIATQLEPEEMRDIAEYYGGGRPRQLAKQ